MANKTLARAKTFVLRYKWFFLAGLVLLIVLAVLPRVLGREGLAARCSAGKVWNGKKCVCAGASEWDGKKCVTCGPGMKWDWNKKPRAGCECLPGTKWNGKFCAKPATNAAKKQDCFRMPPNNTGGSLRPVQGGFSRDNVYVTYHTYGDPLNGDDAYDTLVLACSDAIGDTKANGGERGKKLLKYPWTAFCMGYDSKMCGKCLRVTNKGVSTVVRIVDNGGCSGGAKDGLDLQPCAFNAIDTDGQGHHDGHMFVKVEEVECGADAEL